MNDGLLLDTHVWLWLALNSPKIASRIRGRLAKAALQDQLHVSAISLLEVANLVRTKRIDLALPLSSWFSLFFAANELVLLPVTPEIAVATTLLPRDFHGDLGDRLIAATAQVHNLTLCTHDRALLRFGKLGVYPFLEV